MNLQLKTFSLRIPALLWSYRFACSFFKRLVLLIFLLPALSLAQIPHTFTNGEFADAEQINENFETLRQLLSESLRPHNESGSVNYSGRSIPVADRFEVDCTQNDQALKNAIAGGHSAITVVAGTCDANTDNIELIARRLGISGIATNGIKPVLDTSGGRFDSSASVIQLSNLVLRGGVRTRVGFLGLTNVEIDCSSITDPSEHGIWVYGSQLSFQESSLEGCGGIQAGYNALIYSVESNISTVAGAANALNLFQGATARSVGTSWRAAEGDLMWIGTGTDLWLVPPILLEGTVGINFGGFLSVSDDSVECPETAEPRSYISLGLTSLVKWPDRCPSFYPVGCRGGLSLFDTGEGLTCR